MKKIEKIEKSLNKYNINELDNTEITKMNGGFAASPSGATWQLREDRVLLLMDGVFGV